MYIYVIEFIPSSIGVPTKCWSLSIRKLWGWTLRDGGVHRFFVRRIPHNCHRGRIFGLRRKVIVASFNFDT